MGTVSWIEQNWFLLLQGLGILGGLLFTGLSLGQANKGRKITNLLELSEQHRQLWTEVRERPELARILRTDVDLIAAPITVAEEAYMNLVFNHFSVGWTVARAGSLLTLSALALDVAAFFSLPIPRSVWEETKGNRDRKFVCFVQRVLASHRREGIKAATSRATRPK